MSLLLKSVASIAAVSVVAAPVVVAVGAPSATTLFDDLRADTALGNKAALADAAVSETVEAQPADVGEAPPEPAEPAPPEEPSTPEEPGTPGEGAPPGVGGGAPVGGGGSAGGGGGGLGLGGLAGIAGLAAGIAALASADDDNPTPASPN